MGKTCEVCSIVHWERTCGSSVLVGYFSRSLDLGSKYCI